MPRDQFSPAPPGAAADRGGPVVPSRRSVLRGAAGVGAAGIAATAFAGLGGTALAATARPDGEASRADEAAPEAAESEQIVVHLRDARTGQIDLFRGTSQIQVRDTDLAARLVRASQSAASQTSKQVR